MTVRTRFAPSPTGRLHLGNVRAAVFNWLFARRHGGAFILRIEDTDVERNVGGGEEAIAEDLRWLGLDWDEGPGVEGPHAPYRQSGRTAVYAAAVDTLLAAGRAYPCFCGEGDLEAEIGKEGREVRHYFGRCRDLDGAERARRVAQGPPPVIRFAVPKSLSSVDVQDEVFGPISFPISDIDDFVIRRSDGRVTYNFAVVVDDVDMEISHVIRGVGHLSNTPKQALMFDALERPRPVFAHLPTVLGADGRKLSKREGAAAVAELRRAGYPPDAVVNYLSLLGWSHPDGKEVLSRQELVEAVGLDRVGRSDTQMDPEKLLWISAQHLAGEDLPSAAAQIAPFLDRARFGQASERWPQVVEALRSRLSTYGDINEHLPLLFGGREDGPEAREALRAYPDAHSVLEQVAQALEEVAGWEQGALGAAVRQAGSRLGARGAALFHPVRLALIGSETGPDLGKTLAALGRDEALRRLRRVASGSRPP
ncbi:MAG: glutamate--tRNA ligase [Longimicrobiales bacterium]|nr:glutamate--tRNA ligase [Longimicrobiales bacterium]